MNILNLVKQYIRDNGWPERPINLGPATCGDKCRKLHAYSQAIKAQIGSETFYSFIYQRPCNEHEAVRKSMLKDKRWIESA